MGYYNQGILLFTKLRDRSASKWAKGEYSFVEQSKR